MIELILIVAIIAAIRGSRTTDKAVGSFLSGIPDAFKDPDPPQKQQFEDDDDLYWEIRRHKDETAIDQKRDQWRHHRRS